jgi:hypothetical protein
MKKERAVLVCTSYGGVFYGWATETSGDTIFLKRARCCISWTSEVKGFVGLATIGTIKGCKVSPPADIELRKVTCVVEMTEEAVINWEKAPW